MSIESIRQLIAANPLPKAHEAAKAMNGSLEDAAHLYFRQAAYNGSNGNWWSVWLAIQYERGITLSLALECLPHKALGWFAQWAFANGAGGDGVVAYQLLLARWPKDASGPFEHQNRPFLHTLLTERRYSEIVKAVDRIAAIHNDHILPIEQTFAAQALIKMGHSSEARRRLDLVRQRYHDIGEVWACFAMLAKHEGNDSETLHAIREASKLGVFDKEVQQRILSVFQIDRSEWERQCAPFAHATDFEQQRRDWLSNPGARIMPCKPGRSAIHFFGGTDFQMPECWGCKRPIRQWYVFNVKAEPKLKAILPDWPKLPLLGCADCCVYMGRHDYEVEFNSSEIRLANVATDCKAYGTSYSNIPAIPRQAVTLNWIEPRNGLSTTELDNADYGDWSRPQIGGTPAWTQDDLRVFCRTCRDEMKFVAAMASTSDFEPYVPINNESGFQYHFACNKCRTLSVIAQWT